MKAFAPLALAATPAFAALAPQSAVAQAYPAKPLRLIVPYAPGGATDIISRAAAIEMSKSLGQAVTVDNRPGAGGNLGAEMAEMIKDEIQRWGPMVKASGAKVD